MYKKSFIFLSLGFFLLSTTVFSNDLFAAAATSGVATPAAVSAMSVSAFNTNVEAINTQTRTKLLSTTIAIFKSTPTLPDAPDTGNAALSRSVPFSPDSSAPAGTSSSAPPSASTSSSAAPPPPPYPNFSVPSSSGN